MSLAECEAWYSECSGGWPFVRRRIVEAQVLGCAKSSGEAWRCNRMISRSQGISNRNRDFQALLVNNLFPVQFASITRPIGCEDFESWTASWVWQYRNGFHCALFTFLYRLLVLFLLLFEAPLYTLDVPHMESLFSHFGLVLLSVILPRSIIPRDVGSGVCRQA